MVHGDAAMPSADGGAREGMATDRWQNDHAGPVAPSYSYADLLKRRGSMLSFVQAGGAAAVAAGVASSGPAAQGAADAAVRSPEEGEKVDTLRAIVGTEPSDDAVRALLQRYGWDVQRAVAAHFNDGADAAAPGGGAGGGGGAAAERGAKRPAKSAGGQQKSKQRSVLSMWGQQT